MLRILHLEDSPRDTEIIRNKLEAGGLCCEFLRVETEAQFTAALAGEGFDLILCDYNLPGYDGLDALALALEQQPGTPVLLISGTLGEDKAVQCLQLGATDYLLKQRLERLPSAVKRALDEAAEQRQHHQVALKLRASEERYRTLVDCAPYCIHELDTQGRLTSMNRAGLAMLGVVDEDAIRGTDYLKCVVPNDRARLGQLLHQALQGHGSAFEFTSLNGRNFQSNFIPIKDAQGAVLRLMEITQDITARKELEEQLRQSQKMDAIGQLAGGIAHDFNNLLTIIQGYSQLLLTQANLTEDTAEQIREIYRAGERAANLTRQLLTFSRKQKISPRDLDLNELVRNINKMLQRIIGENITLQCAFAPALPPVLGDAGMMDQILLNLSINARDAMPKGGRLIIETAVVELNDDPAQRNPNARAGRFVCLSVQDTGSGIAPEHLAHIFEPFFTTKEVGQGTGLGLATVFGIVQQHHGWMEVKSTVGTGTTFKVFLPAITATATPATEFSRKTRGGTETILVVENEEVLRRIVLVILRKQGYRVLEAASGVKALAVWEEHATEIDLLLTDLVMPDGLTGRELAEQLQTKRPSLKVIYTSGYSPEFAGSNLALKEGLNFLQKPYRPQQLAQAVRDCLDD